MNYVIIMNELDNILSVVENPTRRRILQAIVREPHYPLQLSRELGISQQAVVKNLDIMERNGLVISYRESSDRGPDRIFYRPSTEFSIVIDLRNGMFETRMIIPSEPEGGGEKFEKLEELEDLRKKISDIDGKLKECERIRSGLVRERNELITGFFGCVDCTGMDYVHRNLLYDMLNNPDMGIKEMSRGLGVNEDILDEMMTEILKMFGTRKE